MIRALASALTLTLVFAGCGGSATGDCACLEGQKNPIAMSMTIEQCVFMSDADRNPTNPYEYCNCKEVGTGAPQTNIPPCR